MTPGGLRVDRQARTTGESEPVARSVAHVLTFPAQQHKLGPGREVLDRATGSGAGTILELDREARTLKLKRGPKLRDASLPEALIPGGIYATSTRRTRSSGSAAHCSRAGGAIPRSSRSCVARRSTGRCRRPISTRWPSCCFRSTAGISSSRDRRLGKTFTAGRLIARLIAAGKTVGVASTSHRAIHKLLAEVEDSAEGVGLGFRGLKKASGGNPESEYEGRQVENVFSNDDCAAPRCSAGRRGSSPIPASTGRSTTCSSTRPAKCRSRMRWRCRPARGTSCSSADPQQLGQVLQGSHPTGTEASVLEHLLGGEATVPPDRGLFLERTFRLHPDVCAYISEEFYEGRLQPDPVTSKRTTPLGTGAALARGRARGPAAGVAEEAEAVRAEIERCAAGGGRRGGGDQGGGAVQRAGGAAALEAAGRGRGGTVDKFQGQEAKVVFYSMASSSGEDVPRGLDFLLSEPLLNVAISRASAWPTSCARRGCWRWTAGRSRTCALECLCRFVEVAEEDAS